MSSIAEGDETKMWDGDQTTTVKYTEYLKKLRNPCMMHFIYTATVHLCGFFFLILKPKNEEYIVLIMNYLPMGVEVVPKSFCKQLLGLI